MRWLLVSLGLLLAGCSAKQEGQVVRDAHENTAQNPGLWEDGNGVEATEPHDFESLEVPDFLPAVVFAPASGGPHPLIIAAHGAGGMPEWECDYWRRLSRGRAFLLCLRGERTNNAAPSGYYYRTHLALGQEFRAALAAFRQRFPDAPRRAALYAGFSQGAIMGAPMIVEHGDECPYLALIEGGYEYWSLANAKRFAQGGGKRVLFVCGTQWCADKAEIPAAWLRKANVAVRIEHAPGAGHTPSGEVMVRTGKALPWLTADDPIWN